MKIKLTDNRSRGEILIEAIRKIYPMYTCISNGCGHVGEISQATEDLVKSYILNFMDHQFKKSAAIELIILIIEGSCRRYGLGNSDKFRAELYSWILEIETEYRYPVEE